MEDQELLPILESVLFVSGEPVSMDRLRSVLEGLPEERIRDGISKLQDQYFQNGHGLQLAEVAGGVQMVTRPECSPWIRRLEKVKNAVRLSKPALETLAIIAYKQPVIRTEIEEIRGVDSMGVLKTLLERRLIKINGRRDAVGRPMMYGTTKEFLMYFGLNRLEDLPTLRDFQELAREEGESVEDSSEDEDQYPQSPHPSEENTSGNENRNSQETDVSEEIQEESRVTS